MLYFGLELWDGPLEVGWGTSALLHLILAFCATLARQRGLGLTYSFGNDQGERPCFAFALAGADRIFVSNAAVPLPIMGSAAMGVWEIGADGGHNEIERQSLSFDTRRHFTFLFASPRVDFSSWNAPTGVPALGTVDIERVIGKQGVHIVVFSEDVAAEASSPDKRKYLCELAIDAPVDVRETEVIREPVIEDDALSLARNETPQYSWTSGYVGVSFVLLLALLF